MGLQRFEHRLEQLVEGAFAKAFRSGLQPVEIGRRLARELDAGRTVGVRGTVAPNAFTVTLSPEDHERFAGFQDALVHELQESVREHARDEHYTFIGPVEVTLLVDGDLKRGNLRVGADIVANERGLTGSLVLPDGRRFQLGDATVTLGRLSDCAIVLSDPQASRHHAEVRYGERGYMVADLGSTNGTMVNGMLVTTHHLRDGDVIGIGSTAIRYEES